MLHGENFIHAFETQTALFIQEVRNMGLLEPGLLRQPQSGQAAFADALPNRSAKIILQHAEFHGPEYSTRYSLMLIKKVFHNPIGISTLTLKIHSYTIASSYNSILARWDRGHGRWIQR